MHACSFLLCHFSTYAYLLFCPAGAALELSTILAPHAFLPLACSANLAKNLAAVAASSTRAPIYRTFALQNNLADITAKGESVANLADILGTLAGRQSRVQLPLHPACSLLLLTVCWLPDAVNQAPDQLQTPRPLPCNFALLPPSRCDAAPICNL
jgi:hypothetical protein